MADEGSHHSHSRVDDHRSRRRHRSRSYDSREKEVNESVREEQSDKRRHHRHRRRHSRRSLSPGEIPPVKRHRSKHAERRPHGTPETSETREIESFPENKVPPPEQHIHHNPSAASESSDSDDIYGPMPAIDKQQQSKSKRPPRRGEYGHDAEEIEKFERMGFVMSGNRRKRKNDSTDDTSTKAGLMLQKEEKALRETEIVARFREMIQERKEMKQ